MDHSHRINDWEKFKQFACLNKDKTIVQMAEKWTQLTGQSTSGSAIGRGLKKIGFTHKKKHFTIVKQTKKREKNI